MAKTVVGLFDTEQGAERAVRDLLSRGFARDDISVVANNTAGIYSADATEAGDHTAEGAGTGAVGGTFVGGGLGLLVGLGLLALPGIGPVAAAGTLAAVLGSTALGAGIGAAAGGLVGALVGSGVPEDEANVYAEGVRRGGTLVQITTVDERADDAVAALEASDPVNVEQREADLRSEGWERFNPQGVPYNQTEIDTYRTSTVRPADTTAPATTPAVLNDTEAVLPVIEEELTVGKREVQRGRVRIHTRVIETPVEESVQLHEERVQVERRPVNRDLDATDTTAFKEQSFELRETAEEAVVAKRARVVEEVIVDKDVEEQVETVRDTVRRTDVQVEDMGVSGLDDYSRYSADFRSYYDSNYASSGRAYDEYDPAFRYGYTVAGDRRYNGKEWTSVEADLRSEWEREQRGPWDQFKDSVRYAWERARERA